MSITYLKKREKKTVVTITARRKWHHYAPLHYSNLKLDWEPLRSEMTGSINQKQPVPVLRTEDALHRFARCGATPDRSRGESYAENLLLTGNSSPTCPTTSLGPQMRCSTFEVVQFSSLCVSSMF